MVCNKESDQLCVTGSTKNSPQWQSRVSFHTLSRDHITWFWLVRVMLWENASRMWYERFEFQNTAFRMRVWVMNYLRPLSTRHQVKMVVVLIWTVYPFAIGLMKGGGYFSPGTLKLSPSFRDPARQDLLFTFLEQVLWLSVFFLRKIVLD